MTTTNFRSCSSVDAVAAADALKSSATEFLQSSNQENDPPDDNDDEEMLQLKQQWNRLLPVYGNLWKSLLLLPQKLPLLADGEENATTKTTRRFTDDDCCSSGCCTAPTSFVPAEILRAHTYNDREAASDDNFDETPTTAMKESDYYEHEVADVVQLIDDDEEEESRNKTTTGRNDRHGDVNATAASKEKEVHRAGRFVLGSFEHDDDDHEGFGDVDDDNNSFDDGCSLPVAGTHREHVGKEEEEPHSEEEAEFEWDAVDTNERPTGKFRDDYSQRDDFSSSAHTNDDEGSKGKEEPDDDLLLAQDQFGCTESKEVAEPSSSCDGSHGDDTSQDDGSSSSGGGSTVVNFDQVSFDLSPRSLDGGDMWGASAAELDETDDPQLHQQRDTTLLLFSPGDDHLLPSSLSNDPSDGDGDVAVYDDDGSLDDESSGSSTVIADTATAIQPPLSSSQSELEASSMLNHVDDEEALSPNSGNRNSFLDNQHHQKLPSLHETDARPATGNNNYALCDEASQSSVAADGTTASSSAAAAAASINPPTPRLGSTGRTNLVASLCLSPVFCDGDVLSSAVPSWPDDGVQEDTIHQNVSPVKPPAARRRSGRSQNTSIVIFSSEDESESRPEPNPSQAAVRIKKPTKQWLSSSAEASANVLHISSDSSQEEEWRDDHSMAGRSSSDEQSRANKHHDRIKERSKRAAILFDSSDDDSDLSSSIEEAEWIDPLIELDDGGVDELIKRTKEIAILGDGEDGTVPRRDKSMSRPKPLKLLSKPRAESSKVSFRKDREELSQRLLQVFDRTAFDGLLLVRVPGEDELAVTVTWSTKLRTTAGLTRLKRKAAYLQKEQNEGACYCRTAVIELSTKVIDDESRLRSTLLHELCHAAAWVVDGTMKPAHGSCFKKWAGKAMTAVPNVVVTTTHDYEIDYKYTWVCTIPSCEFVVQRHSRSVDVTKHVCGRCKGRLQEVRKGKSSSGKADFTPRKKAAPSAYNLFVKDHSTKVRERLEADSGGKVTQPDVMKECARLWHEHNGKKV